MEGRCCSILLLQIVVLVATFIDVAYSSLSEEIAENKESVRFDGIYKLEDWPTDKTEAFRNAAQIAVNDYCAAELSACQIDAYNNTNPFVVTIESDGVEYFNGDIKITFHVRLPTTGVSSSSELEYVLAKATVNTILMRNTTVAAIETATGYELSYIGSTRLESVDHSLDVIMIPVACVLFLLVVLLAVILVCRESQHEKKKQAAVTIAGDKKGEEGITLTAVKSTSDDSGENNEVKA